MDGFKGGGMDSGVHGCLFLLYAEGADGNGSWPYKGGVVRTPPPPPSDPAPPLNSVWLSSGFSLCVFLFFFSLFPICFRRGRRRRCCFFLVLLGHLIMYFQVHRQLPGIVGVVVILFFFRAYVLHFFCLCSSFFVYAVRGKSVLAL